MTTKNWTPSTERDPEVESCPCEISPNFTWAVADSSGCELVNSKLLLAEKLKILNCEDYLRGRGST